MSSFVLDCSVTMSWCFEDEGTEYTNNILQSFKTFKALVPPLWIIECTNVLITAEKRNRLTMADAVRFLDLLHALPIHLSDISINTQELLSTAHTYNLTAYDSQYLLLAMHEGLSIATNDKALIKASQVAGVNIFNP